MKRYTLAAQVVLVFDVTGETEAAAVEAGRQQLQVALGQGDDGGTMQLAELDGACLYGEAADGGPSCDVADTHLEVLDSIDVEED